MVGQGIVVNGPHARPGGRRRAKIGLKTISESASPFNSYKKFGCLFWVVSSFSHRVTCCADRIPGSYCSSSVSLRKFSLRVRVTLQRQRREIKRNLVLDNITELWQNTLEEFTLSLLTELIVALYCLNLFELTFLALATWRLCWYIGASARTYEPGAREPWRWVKEATTPANFQIAASGSLSLFQALGRQN